MADEEVLKVSTAIAAATVEVVSETAPSGSEVEAPSKASSEAVPDTEDAKAEAKEEAVSESAKAADRALGWTPLESNAVVLTDFAQHLGCPISYQFEEIWAMDPVCFGEMQVKAVIFLFGMVKGVYKKSADKALVSHTAENIYYVKQMTQNACGAVATIHCITNTEGLELEPGPLTRFQKETEGMDGKKKGEMLDEATYMMEVSERAATSVAEGGHGHCQTVAPARGDPTDAHFIAFVTKNEAIYEMDGRGVFKHTLRNADGSERPVKEETFMSDVVEVVHANYDLSKTLQFFMAAFCKIF